MNLVMTVLAYRKCFALFCYHRQFPQLFSFEVLHFVYMVYFQRYIGFSAQLTYTGGQPVVK